MSQFDLKKFLVENKLTTNSRRMINEYGKGRSLRGKPVFAPEYDPYDGPDSIEVFMDAAEDSSIFNQKLVNDIQALIDRADYNGKLNLSAVDNPEDEVVQVLVDVWKSGMLPHTISDYVYPDVLIKRYGFTQEKLDSDRAEYDDDTEDYQPLDEFFFYDEKDVQRTDGPMDDQERLQRFLKQIQTSFSGLADYLGLSTQELYQMLEEEGLDAVMDYYDTAQDKNADFIPESFQKKRR